MMASVDDMLNNIRAYIEGGERLTFSQREKTPVLWQLEQVREEVAELKKALAWYANPGNYYDYTDSNGMQVEAHIVSDRGARAREALGRNLIPTNPRQ